jgi:hypothetical protein
MENQMNKLWAAQVIFIALTVFIVGCSSALTPVNHAPLATFPFTTTNAPDPRVLLIVFSDTTPGIPMAETVWDNEHGPFASTQESQRIGYTWKQVKPVAGAPVVTSDLRHARFSIPFGRVFENVFQSGLKQEFPNSAPNVEQFDRMDVVSGKENYLFLQITEFQVWEYPANQFHMTVTLDSRLVMHREDKAIQFTRHPQCFVSLSLDPLSGNANLCKALNQMANDIAACQTRSILGCLHDDMNHDQLPKRE